YEGHTLMDLLENIDIEHDVNTDDFRFPVQWVCRPQTEALHDFRGYMGRIESGSIRVGDQVTILPSGLSSRIKEILLYKDSFEDAFAPQSVTLTIEDHLDISRGDMLVKTGEQPQMKNEFAAMVCWLSEQPLDPRRKYIVKHTTRVVKGVVNQIDYRVDVNTFNHEAIDFLRMNDIARVMMKVHQRIVFDGYAPNRATGSFIIIDETSNNTVAAGMIC